MSNSDLTHYKLNKIKVNMSSKNGDKYVKYSLFFITIGLVLSLMAILFNWVRDLPADVAVIKTDISYIKEDIVEIKKTLTKNIVEVIDSKDMVFADEPTVYDHNFTPPTTAP